MNILFIHQNFPGQYLHLVCHVRSQGGHNIAGLGETQNIRNRGTLAGITTIGYPQPQGAGERTHHYLAGTEAAVRRGQAVVRALLDLKKKGFTPDLVSLHPGWGEGLFVRDLFPKVPILMYCEYYFRARGADLGFDPEFPSARDAEFSIRVRNSAQLVSLTSANACISPTTWQASRYPDMLRERMRIIHDGIDTNFMCPDAEERLSLQPMQTPGESRVQGFPERLPPGARGLEKVRKSDSTSRGDAISLGRGDKVLTYVARNLEPYRGFHIFMRSLPEIQRRHPDAQIMIVGRDGVSYSPRPEDGRTYKEQYLEELDGKIDLSRVHFLGRIPYPALRALFRISSAHVYLTYPFVLSWSALEAMSCGALLVASDTDPVREVMQHEKNALLTDFFDHQALAESVDRALSEPRAFDALRRNARETVVDGYSLEKCLPKQYSLLMDLAAGVYPVPW
ncbi:glycosyltransferase family 4 protein [Desulfovibrio sp. OttesenSCG-928-A18]|nr:glycosyltransferase family 4 protein [Desulfovibrio sp. OttesenSCG-928-A18]